MGVQTQIDRIRQNIASAYATLKALGATMPTEQSSENLAATAGTAKVVLYSAQKLDAAQQLQARENIGIDAAFEAKIVVAVIEELGGLPVSGYIDGDNNIVLTSNNLADGTYTIAYKLADGTYAGTGSLTVGTEVEPEPEPEPDEPEYTNILTSGAYTIEMNKRWSGSAKAFTECNGMIGFVVPSADVNNKTIRFKGFTKDLKASNQPPLWMYLSGNNTKVGTLEGADTTGNVWVADTLTDEGNGVYSVVPSSDVGGVAYVVINMAVNESTAVTTLDGLIMTIDEEIA